MLTQNQNLSPDDKHSHLQHVDIKHHYQFITFRTNDSIDAYLKKITRQDLPNSKLQLAIDEYLDQSGNGAYLNGEILILLRDFIQSKNNILYRLAAFCIMPNHVHLLIEPLGQLADIIRRLKGGSAKLINEKQARKGTFWAPDYYDKLIRDEKHFSIVYQYIKNNPLVLSKAGAPQPRFFGIYE
jgi:REP element-mobilizing transposase RayT